MAKFIKLTEAFGGTINVNIGLAVFIRDVPEGAYGFEEGARSDVNFLGSQGGVTFTVKETPEQILALIEREQSA